MSDQEKPAFSVVDKRQAAQGEDPQVLTSQEEPTASSEPQAAPTDGQPFPIETDNNENVSEDTPDADPSEAADDMQMPDPGFLFSMAAMQMETRELMRISMGAFDAHAWRALGLIANPVTGEAKKDLPSAQLAIDCVQFLLGKVEAGLPESERRDASRRLNDLRMNYLAKLREP